MRLYPEDSGGSSISLPYSARSHKRLIEGRAIRVHELSLAAAVLQIALRHASGRRVTRIELEVGALRQVVAASLSFSIELLAEGTCAQGASIEIKTVDAVGNCRRCGVMSKLSAFPLQCAACGEFDLKICSGEELTVTCLELEDIEYAGIQRSDSDRFGNGGHPRCQ